MRVLTILFLSCLCLFGQTALYAPFTKFASSGFNYGSLFLFVDAASANSTNANNNDVVTTLADWGTNKWTVGYNSTQNGRWRNDGTLSNNLAYIVQTNTSSVISQSGINVPAQWMASSDTNYTITWVLMAKAPQPNSSPFVLSADESAGGNGYLLWNAGGTTLPLESWDRGGTVDVISGNLVYSTNNWMIMTLVHGTGGSFVFYTNNIQAFSGGPGNSQAIGYLAASHPTFLGGFTTGSAATWCGLWKRIMMWKYAMSGTERTNDYVNLKSELGLSGLP